LYQLSVVSALGCINWCDLLKTMLYQQTKTGSQVKYRRRTCV